MSTLNEIDEVLIETHRALGSGQLKPEECTALTSVTLARLVVEVLRKLNAKPERTYEAGITEGLRRANEIMREKSYVPPKSVDRNRNAAPLEGSAEQPKTKDKATTETGG